MKTTFRRSKAFIGGLLPLVLLGWLIGATPAAAQGTSFTYQGRAVFEGYSANGNLDLTFGLFDAASAGTQIGSTITNLDVAVSNGLFTVTLDFGGTAFPGADRWLELGLRTNGTGGPFVTLSPRQQLTPAPYAVTAAGFTGTVQDSQLSANVALLNGSQTFSGANTFSSGNTFAGNGSGLTSLNAGNLASGTVADARLSGNVALLNGANVFTGSIQATVGGVDYFMVPRGSIVLWSGSVASIPSGWALCDGQNSTPNLTNQFVVGAGDTTKGALYAVGAAGGATNHTHGVGSFATVANSTGTGTTGSESSHTHGVGSFVTVANSTGTGTTGGGTTGTGTTGSESSHTHTVPGLSGGNLQFARQVDFGGSGASGGPWIISVFSGTSGSPKFNTSWAGSTGTGTSGAGSAHSHSIPGLSVPGLSVPALSIPALAVGGTSGAGSAHSHSIPALSIPALTVGGTSGSADSRPPYYALCYIMKL